MDLGRLIRVVTGHNNTGRHRHHVDESEDETCRYWGEERETFVHFISTCPYFQINRNRILLKSLKDNSGWVLSEIMEFAKIQEIEDVLDPQGHYSGEPESDSDSDGSDSSAFSSSSESDSDEVAMEVS